MVFQPLYVSCFLLKIVVKRETSNVMATDLVNEMTSCYCNFASNRALNRSGHFFTKKTI